MNPSDKVVCIDDSPCRCCGVSSLPLKKGAVYVVVSSYPSAISPGRVGLILAGMHSGHGQGGFNSERFRLLSEVQMIVSAVTKHKPTAEPIVAHKKV